MAYYVGTKEFPSVYDAIDFVRVNGGTVTNTPSAPSDSTSAGMLTGSATNTTGYVKGDPTKQAPIVRPPTTSEPAPAPEPETEERTFTFIEGSERGQAMPGELYGQTVEPQQVTESYLRDYFNDPKRTNRLPEVFGSFDNYLAYMTEREELIQSGE